MKPQPSHSKNEEIEALRGVAVLLVVFGHLENLFSWAPGFTVLNLGFGSGVDIFFCISGFVIANSFYRKFYLTAHAGDTVGFFREVVAFYIRRVYRIIPSAWAWLLVVAACSVYFNKSGIFVTLKANLFDALAVMLSLANFHFANCIAHTLGDRVCGNNGIYWSVSLEEQFYLLFPLLFFLRLRWIFVIAAAVLAGFCIFGLTAGYTAFTLFSRVDGMLLGVCIAILKNHSVYQVVEPKFLSSKIKSFVGAIALISFTVLAPAFGGVAPASMTIVTILCGAIIFTCSYGKGYLFSDSILRKILAVVGTRSFAIYLIHNPVYWATRELWYRIEGPNTHFSSFYTLRFSLTAGISLIILSELNYRLLETPLRKHGIAKAKEFLAGRYEAMPEPISDGARVDAMPNAS